MNGIEFIPFLLAALAIELTPGPNMFYIALLSAQNGRKSGYAVVVGVALGLSIVGLLALTGFSALVAQNAFLYEALRWAGVLYLAFIGLQTILAKRKPAKDGASAMASLKPVRAARSAPVSSFPLMA